MAIDSCDKDIRNGWTMLFWSSLEQRYYKGVELHIVGQAEMLALHTTKHLNQNT